MTSKSVPGLQAQPEALDPPLEHRRPPDQDRPREALVDDHLHRAQHALVLALGVDDPLRLLLRRGEDGLHQQAGVVDELRQPLPVGVEILDRPRRHAASPSPPSPPRWRSVTMSRGSNGFGIRYSGPKLRFSIPYAWATMSDCSAIARSAMRAHRRELHLLVHRRRADVERAAEDEREAQHVVDLVREVGAPGGDDRVGARRLGDVGHDLGLGIGERQDQRLVGHQRQPSRASAPRRRTGRGRRRRRASTSAERARVGGLRVARLVLVHQLGAPGVDDAGDVDDEDVLARRCRGSPAGRGRRAPPRRRPSRPA